MVLFSAVDVVAKQRYVKQSKFSVQRQQPKSIRQVIWDNKIANNFMISGQYLQLSAVLQVYQHKLQHAWLISVLITRNRLSLMKKWFAGCGNVKLFELHNNTIPAVERYPGPWASCQIRNITGCVCARNAGILTCIAERA